MKHVRLYSYITFLFVELIMFSTPVRTLAQVKISNDSVNFSYVFFNNGYIVSSHAIKYSLKVPYNYIKIEPYNYKPFFNKHPFNVSLAAAYNNKNLIVVHAEKVTDGSGFLDYSYLMPVKLDSLDFYMKESCLELNEETLEQAIDIKYIKANGFDFGDAIFLKQFFVNTPDGTYEFVLTFGEKVCDCTDEFINDEFKYEFDKKLDETIELSEESGDD